MRKKLEKCMGRDMCVFQFEIKIYSRTYLLYSLLFKGKTALLRCQ